MALLSDKVYLGTDLLDLLLQPHRLPGTAVERSLVDQHIVSQEGVVDHFLDSLFPSSEENLKPCSPLWVPSPCDSGISEDAMDSPHPSYPEATHYTKEAAYSPSPVPGSPLFPAMFLPQVVKMEPDFSIDLADWEAGLFSEGLSSSSSATTISPSPIQKSLTVKDLLLSNMAEPSKPSTQQSRQLILNEDEKKLLVKEGVSLPSQFPLNKYEEKILKKIRRKIRNKQSAQESRKKKKEYVDGLEGRMAACSAHNQELQRKVFQLEKSNTSLLEQLRQLQSLLLNGSSKPAQTGTCILVLVLSFSLILIPSLQPVSHRKTSDLGDIGSAKVQSRSLRSVMEVYTVEPGLSVTRDLDVSSNTKHKLDIRPEYADMSPSRQNHSYRENKRHHHGDPITGHATALSLMTRQQIDKE